MYELYTNRIERGELTTIVRGVPINLVDDDISRILYIPIGGWGNYVKFEWAPLDNLSPSIRHL